MSSISIVKRWLATVPPARSLRDAGPLTAIFSVVVAAFILEAVIANSYIPLCSLYLLNNRASPLIPKTTSTQNFEGNEHLKLARQVLSKRFQQHFDEGAQIMNGAIASNVARLPLPKPRPSQAIAQTQYEQHGFLHSLSKLVGARTIYASLKDRPR